jgi:hypothetical protein
MKRIPAIIMVIVLGILGLLLFSTGTRGCRESCDDIRYKIQNIKFPQQGP